MAVAEGRMRFKVYLGEGQRVAEIFVSPTTQCRDIVHRLQRQIHATDCFLLEVWQGCERLVPDNESIHSTLLEWGSDLEDVKFYLRPREEAPSFTQALNGPSLSQKVNGFKEEAPLSRDVLLGGSRISVNDLKEFAARQQHEIVAKERELKAKQVQLMEMKRKSQNRPQNPYVQQLSAKADEQEERLTALRHEQDQVDSYKLSNSALAEELDSVRSLFMEKEKELAIAVAKVESLTQQLDKQRQGWSQSSPSQEKTHQQLELERLRKELMTRNELNHQQSVQIQAQKQLLAEKHKELFDLDAQIDQYTEQVRQKRSRNNHINRENGSSTPSPTGEQDFLEMDYNNLGNFAKRTHKTSGADSKNGSLPVNSGSFLARSRNSSKLETLLEVEEEVSDGHASNKSSTEDLTEGPGPPMLSRVTTLKSRFETEAAEDRWEHRSAHDKLSNGRKTFMEDVVTSGKSSNGIFNSRRRVEPEGVETPESPSPELLDDKERERFSYRENKLLDNLSFETKLTDQDTDTKRQLNSPSQEDLFELPHSLEMKHIVPESDLETEAPWNSGQTTPSDEGDHSGLSSPSSLSSFSSLSSNSNSPKAAVFAVTGVAKKTDGHASPPRDFYGLKGDILQARGLKIEGFPTNDESVGSVARQTVLDFSRAGIKAKQFVVTDKSGRTSSSNDKKKTANLTEVTTVSSSAKTGKVQLSRLRYPAVSSDKAILQQHAMYNTETAQMRLKREVEDHSANTPAPSDERKKIESSFRGETRSNANESSLPQNTFGTNGLIQNEVGETSELAKRKMQFLLKDNVQKIELNAASSRLPQNVVSANGHAQKGDEVIFSPSSASSNTTAPLRESRKKLELSVKDYRDKTELDTSSSTISQNTISKNNFIPNEKKARTSSSNSTLLNEDQKRERVKDVFDETDNAKTFAGEESHGQSQFVPLTFKPISYRAKKLVADQRDDRTPSNRSQLAPLISNSVSIRGQSSLTKITVTPSATFFSSASRDIPEKRSPVPTSKRTRFVNRTATPDYPEVKDFLASSEENFHDDNDHDRGETVEKESLENEARTQNDSVQNGKKCSFEETNTNQQQGQKTKNISKTRETPRTDVKQVVSSFNIQLSSQSRKLIQKTEEKSPPNEKNESSFLSDKTFGSFTAESKIADGMELNCKSSRLSSEDGEVGFGSARPSSGSGQLSSEDGEVGFESARPSFGSGRLKGDGLNAESGHFNSESSSSRSSGLNSKNSQKFLTSRGNTFHTVNNGSITRGIVFKGQPESAASTNTVSTSSLITLSPPKHNSTPLKDNAKKNQFVVRQSVPLVNAQESTNVKSLQNEPYVTRITSNLNTNDAVLEEIGHVKLSQNLATDELTVSPVEEKRRLKRLFLLGMNGKNTETEEERPVGSGSQRKEETENTIINKDLPVKAKDGDKAVVGIVSQSIDSASDQLLIEEKDSVLTATVTDKANTASVNKEIGLVGQSYQPISDQLLDNSSVLTMEQGPIPSTEFSRNEITSHRESAEEAQAPAQRADRTKKARHVSLDPHAVLLDAAVEGELDLVKQIVGELDDPSEPNSDGITALHNAVCASHDEVVKFLVQYGCDINSQDSHGWTPLHCAAANNATDLARFLVEHGACILAVTSLEKKTPLQCCERGLPGYFSCLTYLNNVQQNFGIGNEGRVYALYSYAAAEQDELSFDRGEELVVLKRGDATEKDWWWAEDKNGETGYIPRNLLGSHARISPVV